MTSEVLIAVAVTYVVGFFVFARGASFHNPQPRDHFWAGLLWPLLVVGIAWRVWTKQATVKWTWNRNRNAR